MYDPDHIEDVEDIDLDKLKEVNEFGDLKEAAGCLYVVGYMALAWALFIGLIWLINLF